MRFDVNGDYDLIDKYVTWVKKYAKEETLFIVEENPRGDNQHLHAMFMSDSSQKNIRDNFIYNFKKTFSDTRAYSIASKEGNLDYICKGPRAISKIKDPKYPGDKEFPKIHFQGSNFSDQDVIRSHEAWWAAAKDFKIGKVEKEQKLSELEAMVEYVTKKRVSPHDKLLLPGVTFDNIIDDIIDYYVTHKKMIRYSMMNEYADSVWLILLNTHSDKKKYNEHVNIVRENMHAYRRNKFM